jgi:parallel beta-helix repeat protein
MKKEGIISKRGLSTVIVTLIIILISLVAIGIFWVVINNLIKGSSENIGLGKITLSAEIKGVNVDNSSNNVTLSVKRNVGEGELTGIKFVFYNNSNTEVITENVELEQLAERRFVLHLSMNVSTLITISIVPVFKTSNGQENLGSVADIFNVRTGRRIQTITNPPTGNQTCTPAVNPCAGRVCGTAVNGTCGNINCAPGCSGNQTCNSTGQCVNSACVPTTCAALGHNCGTYSNGTCGTNLFCGTYGNGSCQSGYNCVAGTCITQIANSYYVDKNNLSGLCSNLYTKLQNNITHPWCTIQRAADLVTAGDTIIVRSGTYDERITFASGNSGSLGNKITFKAEPTKSVIMQGFNTQNSNYLRIEGFNITNNLAGWTGGGIWVSSNYVEVVNNYFYNLQYYGVVTNWNQKPQNTYVSGNKIYHSGAGIILGTNSLVENNEVERLYDYGQVDADYSRFGEDNVTFRNNYFHGSLESEIDGSHVDCWQAFDTNGGYSHNILIENNSCSDAHEGLMISSFYANMSNITLRNNIFSNLWALGIAVQNVSRLTVIHNTFANIFNFGISFRYLNATNEVVKNNIFYNISDSYYAYEGAQISEGDYNLIYLANNPGVPGVHNLIGVNPMFVNPNNRDYRLQPGSPACNSGEGGTYMGAIPC